MEFFIKKIFDRKVDDWVHLQFQKFSRGEFKDRAMIKIKNSNGKYIISTTAEYARELVKMMAEKLGGDKTQVTGALISALDLTGFDYEEKKMAMGVRKYVLNRGMTGDEILGLCERLNKAFFGLSFNVGDEELIIKPKSPKSAKGASSVKKENADVKIDFCKLKTADKNIIQNLLFDNEARDLNFKKIEVKHDFIINDLIIPDELKNEKDFAKVREGALRKGKIIRYLDIEGKKVMKEVEFEA